MDIRALHTLATESRDAAYAAYKVALVNRKSNDNADTEDAFDALRKANHVRDSIYKMLIAEILAR